MTNHIEIVGTFVSEATYQYTFKEKSFFLAFCEVTRTSGIKDVIPVLFTKDIFPKDSINGLTVRINGTLITKNKKDESGNHLLMCVRAYSIQMEYECDINLLEMTGYICQNPVFRYTPKEKIICYINVATSTHSGKNNYIPCIVWGSSAYIVKNWNVGTCVNLKGRFQSRTYTKNEELKTTYEISVQSIEKGKD